METPTEKLNTDKQQLPSEAEAGIMRSVLIFPDFADSGAVDRIRSRFDPAYSKIKPHITLVFPFTSTYTAQQIHDSVVSCTEGIPPFNLTLEDVVVKDTFLFMLPGAGRTSVAELFRVLHNGLFAPYRPHVLDQEEFMPHMTIGTCTEETAGERLSEARAALGKYTAFIDTLSVEIIGPGSQAIIESEIPLRG